MRVFKWNMKLNGLPEMIYYGVKTNKTNMPLKLSIHRCGVNDTKQQLQIFLDPSNTP